MRTGGARGALQAEVRGGIGLASRESERAILYPSHSVDAEEWKCVVFDVCCMCVCDGEKET